MPKARFTGTIDLSAGSLAAPVRKDSGIDLTPFMEKVRESWQRKQQGSTTPGFAVTVPAEAEAAVKSRFREAAKELNLGVAFNVKDNGNGSVTVTMEARQRKVLPPKRPSEAATAKLPAPPAKQTAKR